MKTLVVYYSRTGNTRKIALDIAEKLKASIDEIKDKKNRIGFFPWIFAGRDAIRRSLTEISYSKSPDDYDLVVVGSPVWAAHLSPAIRTYLNHNKFRNIAFFVTAGGGQVNSTFADMIELVLNAKVKGRLGLSSKELKGDYKGKLEEFCKEIA